jgi:hypothetical protein
LTQNCRSHILPTRNDSLHSAIIIFNKFSSPDRSTGKFFKEFFNKQPTAKKPKQNVVYSGIRQTTFESWDEMLSLPLRTVFYFPQLSGMTIHQRLPVSLSTFRQSLISLCYGIGIAERGSENYEVPDQQQLLSLNTSRG